MNIDLTIFRNSIGRILKFRTYSKGDDFVFEEDFHARLLEVASDYLIVEQTFTRSNDEFEEVMTVQKRKLLKGKFAIDTGEIQLSH
jgi:hypothetical protein